MIIEDVKSGRRAMAFLTDEELEILERAIKLVSDRIGIASVSYASGTVTLSYVYNKGGKDEWTDNSFKIVNVGADSKAAVVKDVLEKVFRMIF